MKVIQRNKIKFKVFTEEELKEKLGMRQEDIQVVLEYQDKFPELLQEKEGFCIDGEKLCNQLELKDNFKTWLLGETKYDSKGHLKSQGKLIKYRCIENTDFISTWGIPNAKFTKEEVDKMTDGKRKAHGIKTKIMLTLECAKMIAMRQNNNQGDLVCKYFIIIEKTLRNYEEWDKIRNPQRENANKLKSELKSWAIRNHFDADYNGLYSREFNLLNICLTGKTALEIKSYIGFKDKQTREHLETEINKALDFIQTFDINLIKLNKSFEDRQEMIKQICDITYPNLKFN